MGRLVRRTTVAVLSLAVLTGGALIAPAPAQAAVWNCTFGFSTVGAFAHCASGDSTHYKVAVLCENIFWPTARTQYGPAVPRGGSEPSTTDCGNWFERFRGTPWAVGA